MFQRVIAMCEHSKIASRECEGHIFKIIKNITMKKRNLHNEAFR
jgi:hypothetical protein